MYDEFDDNFELIYEFTQWLQKRSMGDDVSYDDLLGAWRETIMDFLIAREKGD
jgi:hypothetical protein